MITISLGVMKAGHRIETFGERLMTTSFPCWEFLSRVTALKTKSAPTCIL